MSREGPVWAWTIARQKELEAEIAHLKRPLLPPFELHFDARTLSQRVADVEKANAALEEHRRLMHVLTD